MNVPLGTKCRLSCERFQDGKWDHVEIVTDYKGSDPFAYAQDVANASPYREKRKVPLYMYDLKLLQVKEGE